MPWPQLSKLAFQTATSLPWMLSAQINLHRPFYSYRWEEIILRGATSEDRKAAEVICTIMIATTVSSTVCHVQSNTSFFFFPFPLSLCLASVCSSMCTVYVHVCVHVCGQQNKEKMSHEHKLYRQPEKCADR